MYPFIPTPPKHTSATSIFLIFTSTLLHISLELPRFRFKPQFITTEPSATANAINKIVAIKGDTPFFDLIILSILYHIIWAGIFKDYDTVKFQQASGKNIFHGLRDINKISQP